ncbi:hypothetical protein Tco_0731575 [Tanacetum coccineum]
MSETEPIPPTSSVTALRIPIIKKGEYDLWSMKMRQYIAITDHILWDIITNGNQTTTVHASPFSSHAPKDFICCKTQDRKTMRKALLYILSAIPDRHLLSFHDAVDARSLWTAIKARFGGKRSIQEMQKNLLKEHFLRMLELHDATVSIEDANLKVSRKPTICMCIVGATRYGDNLMKIFVPYLLTQASMPTTHDDDDCCKLLKMLWKKIDIRWQVAMITARIRKFMRKTGRSIDLKPKNGINF